MGGSEADKEIPLQELEIKIFVKMSDAASSPQGSVLKFIFLVAMVASQDLWTFFFS